MGLNCKTVFEVVCLLWQGQWENFLQNLGSQEKRCWLGLFGFVAVSSAEQDWTASSAGQDSAASSAEEDSLEAHPYWSAHKIQEILVAVQNMLSAAQEAQWTAHGFVIGPSCGGGVS